jgi:mannose-1-phosphate guanylyltransferase
LKALILIGGFGTRLRPLSCTKPKALFPIINKPLLEWTFEKLAQNGVDEAILAVNKLTEFHIKQQRIQRHGLKVKYSHDPPNMPLGTAGPVKKAERLLGHDESFFILNGDLITEINYRELLNRHNEGKAVATIALHCVDDPSRYGVAELEDSGCIKNFVEKPCKGTEPSKLINAGVYVVNPKILDYIPAGRAVSMEREIFPRLVQERELYGHKVDGLWIDIGKPEEYLQTNLLFLQHFATHVNCPHFFCRDPVAFAKDVKVGENSTVGPNVILGKNVTLGRNVQIQGSVVFENTTIGDGATISGALIGESAFVGKNVSIADGCIIGDHAKVKDNISLGKGTKVCPASDVSQ